MAVSFNHHDKTSWYFGAMSRQDATDLLMAEREGGVFLVRDSATIEGDYVLCVKEDNKVSHYIINKMASGSTAHSGDASAGARYKIGDQMFNDLPALLNFYKVHYLDTTPLIRPAMKKVEKIIARYDFDGKDPDDLPFRKGEILTVVSKDEEQWWTARNSLGQTGSIPVPYVVKYEDKPLSTAAGAHSGSVDQVTSPAASSGNGSNKSFELNHHNTSSSSISSPSNPIRSQIQRRLPCYARVKQAKVPSAYDHTALRLEVGDTIKVTKMNISGQWEGELHGKVGFFPFTHVELIESDTETGSSDTGQAKS